MRIIQLLAVAFSLSAVVAAPKIPAVDEAMREVITKNEIAGAVTAVVAKDKVLHLGATGHSNIAENKPMTEDTIFWIASMTKPVTGVAILMLQDEGKLRVSDPVAKYISEFADLKTPSGKPANLTIAQILNHTSGLGEAGGPEAQRAKTLAELVPIWVKAPMRHAPGEKWSYNQSGINAAGRIVEVLSGMTFDEFLQKRLFDPLGMKNTTFYPQGDFRSRLVTAYSKNRESGKLESVPPRTDYGPRDRPPQGNGGLYSTAPDYARFCQMLLNGGTLNGHRYLSADAIRHLSSSSTGDLPTGFFQNETYGNRGKNYAWGIGTCVLLETHEGVAEVLSPGSYGHGGAWGTQAWIDPKKGVAYILMVQRANFPNSDASDVRRAFQKAAASAMK
jgi:CubicO group peptidase (beta-lactamase class C family)